jgi:hypothetical protein
MKDYSSHFRELVELQLPDESHILMPRGSQDMMVFPGSSRVAEAGAILFLPGQTVARTSRTTASLPGTEAF